MVQKAVAAQVFGKQTSLNEKYERSVANFGPSNDIEKQVANLDEASIGTAKSILIPLYVHLRRKFEQDPESITTMDMVLGELAQKLDEGTPLSPQEQAKLYQGLTYVDEVAYGEVSVALGLSDPKSGVRTEKGNQYITDLTHLKMSTFYNLTGLEPPKASLGIFENVKYLGGRKEELANRQTHGEEQFFAQNKALLKTEAAMARVSDMALENSKRILEQLCDELSLQGKLLDANGAPLPVIDVKETIQTSRDYVALKRIVGIYQGAPELRAMLDNEAAQDTQERLAYAEDLMSEDRDRFAREALKRQLPKSSQELATAKRDLQVRRNQIEKKTVGQRSQAEKDELAAIIVKVPLIDEALRLLTAGGIEKMLADSNEHSLDSLEAQLPNDPKLRFGFLKDMADDLGVGYDPALDIGNAADVATLRGSVDTKLKAGYGRKGSRDRFSLVRFFVQFVGSNIT